MEVGRTDNFQFLYVTTLLELAECMLELEVDSVCGTKIQRRKLLSQVNEMA